MENPAWLFVIASAIAVISIIVVFKQLVSSLLAVANDEEKLKATVPKEQGRFFVKVGIIEAIPIILVVFGFISSQNAGDVDTLLPLAIIAGLLILGLVNVFLTRTQAFADRNSDKIKAVLTTLTLISITFVTTIPFISIVFLLTMLI